MEILAAEQSEAGRRVLRENIEVLGHSPVEAACADDAWAALTAHYPDIALIVLDWDLPGSEGTVLLRRILTDERFGRIPVMVLFDADRAVCAIEAFQAGATECVSRAATQQDLLTRMLECLSQAA
jgi:two-component system chemotaxis response regulator CheY